MERDAGLQAIEAITEPKTRRVNGELTEVNVKVWTTTAIADELNLTKQSVAQWRRVPLIHCRAVSDLTGVPVSVLLGEDRLAMVRELVA